MFVEMQRWHGWQVDDLTVDMIAQLEAEHQALPESECTEAAKDLIFHRLFGPESRGRMRCFDKGPTPSSVKQITAASSSCAGDVVEARLKAQDERLKSQFKKHFRVE